MMKTMGYWLRKIMFDGLVVAIVIVLMARIMIWENFYVPSGSMIPNLFVGDFVIGTKYSYGFSRYSIPFFPKIFKGRVLDFYPPKRGDIIIFYSPKDEMRMVKRVIGVPGDIVQVANNVVHINDRAVNKFYLGERSVEKQESSQKSEHRSRHFNEKSYLQYEETLPNGKTHIAQYVNDYPNGDSASQPNGLMGYKPINPFANTKQFQVGQAQYFVMGDNRDESLDSRSGFLVEYEQIIAKPAFILWSNRFNLHTDSFFSFKGITSFFSNFRTDRFFKKVN